MPAKEEGFHIVDARWRGLGKIESTQMLYTYHGE
jgi:hypothetical protein